MPSAHLACLDGVVGPAGEARDPGHRRGAPARRRRLRGHAPLRRPAVRARASTSSAWSARARTCGSALDLDALRADVARLLEAVGRRTRARLPADRAHARRPAPAADRAAAGPRPGDTARDASRTRRPACSTAIKSLSYAGNMLATRLAQERGGDEALLVTPHGRVLEAPTSSLFWVAGGDPAARRRCRDHILASITRALVIELSRRARSARARSTSCSRPTRRSSPRRRARSSRSPRSTAASCRRTARSRRRRRAACASRSPPSWAERPRSPCALTVIGNRPQFVKAVGRLLARCARATRRSPSTPASTTTTELSPVFFDELELPRARAPAGHRRRHQHVADGADAGRARTADRRCRARRGARLWRHELDAGGRAGGRAGRRAGRARRGGDALVRPRDAGGGQPGRHGPPRRRCCCARRRRRWRTWRASRSRAPSSWSAT